MISQYALVTIVTLFINYPVQSVETHKNPIDERTFRLYGFDIKHSEFEGKCGTVTPNIAQCEVTEMDRFCNILGFSGSFYGELKLEGFNDTDLDKHSHLRMGFVYMNDETFHIICKYYLPSK